MTQVTVATKINTQAAGLFQTLAESKGMTPSELIANMINIMLKLASVGNVTDPMLKDAMFMWEAAEQGQTNLTQKGKAEVVECIYILQQIGQKHLTALLVEPSFFDESKTSDNNIEILDEILHVCAPSLSKRLKRIQKELDTNSQYETLLALTDYYEHHEDRDHNYIEQMFDDQSSYHMGKDMGDIIQYVRHRTNTMRVTQLELFKDNEQRHQLPTPDTERTMGEDGQETEGRGTL